MKHIFTYLIYCVFSLVIYSCEKKYDLPPLKQVNDGARISIRELKERVPLNLTYVHAFKGGDTNVYCTVISDEISGNFYQQVFVTDTSGGAIQLNLKESGGLNIGDKIRLNLNATSLICANNMIYLDSVDVTKNIVKLSSGNLVVPKQISPDAILNYSNTPTHANSMQSQLVQLNGMEFKPNTLVTTFADAIGKTSVNQTIASCDGKYLTVRTSGRCNFAAKPLPKGNGTIIGIVSQYNSTMQLTIRNYSDVNMTAPLCNAPTSTVSSNTYLTKDFNDLSVSSGGWTTYSAVNSLVNWTTGTSSTTPGPFAKISGYVGGNTNSESWLISPAINTSSAKDPVLSFRSAAKFSGLVLEVLVSNNYSSGDPANAGWTSLAPNYSLSPNSSDYLWTASGYVSLSAFIGTNMRIAFKYKSTTSGATSYQLDDIVVRER